ncbi:MAG: small multi-drug export protein [Candidatus Caldatribacteriota bacterium]
MINDLLRVFLLSTLPISELRGAIPLGLLFYKLPILLTYVVSILGNILPIVFILKYLEFFYQYFSRWKWGERFFHWLFQRTRAYETKYEKYGAIFLLFFVAIPLPITGAWTGAAIAFVFGIRFWYAFPAICGGVLVSGLLVTLASLGIINLL